MQKKSASGSRMLSQDIFPKCYFDLKMPKMIFKTLVSATAIYQTKRTFTAQNALFLLFQTLPYGSKLFPDRQILKSLLVVSISFKQLPSSYFTTLACK